MSIILNGSSHTVENLNRNEIARRRWKILARALQKSSEIDSPFLQENDTISVRRFTSFSLFSSNIIVPDISDLTAQWFEYSTEIMQKVYSILIRHPHVSFSAVDLMGFNNTGNICIWPSEEVLAYYALCNLDLFSNKTVLELGGGSTCLAGLMIGKYAKASNILLTDGNIAAINNVKHILEGNSWNMVDIACSVLQWGNFREKLASQDCRSYDVILSADCLFFDDARRDLVDAIWVLLNEQGIAYVMAPQRGCTFDKFEEECKSRGFECKRQQQYNDDVWLRHLKMKENDDNYDENIHFPLLLLLSKPHLGTDQN